MTPLSLSSLCATIVLASTGIGQTIDCRTDQVPSQITNFTRVLTVPRFDPVRGELLSINLQITGSMRGSARIESLDAAVTIVNTRFQVDLTVTQADMPVVMFMLPIADFTDSLSAFDGIVDYAGTSGVTHAGIEATDQLIVSVPLNDANRAIFTGIGTVEFTADAAANSISIGSGNLLAQFDTSAGVDLEVCYTFVPNLPPTVNCPGPLMASVGVPLQFQVCAMDPDAGDQVTLNGILPPGATANPPFPVVGNPACTTISWTPQSDQIGNTPFVFTANDILDTTATCTTVVGSAECHMIFGVGGDGSSSVTLFGHLYDTQLARVRVSYPVTMADHPSFAVRALPPVMTVQVLMYNPLIFAENPSQWSRPMTIVRNADYSISTTYAGHANGIEVRAELFQQDGRTRAQFPFTIAGM